MECQKTLLKEIAQKDFATLEETATIATAVSVFQREGIEEIFILNSNPRVIKGVTRLHLFEKLATGRTDPSLPLISIVSSLSVMDENLPILDIPQVSWSNPFLIATVNSQGKLSGIVTQKAFMEAYWHDTRFLLRAFSELESLQNRLNDMENAVETMKMVFEDAIEGVVLVDQNGIIQYVNQRCAESMGHTRESALGKHISDFTADTQLPSILKSGKPIIGVIVKSPTQGNMVASGFPLRRDGKIVGAVGIILFSDSQKMRDLTKKIDLLEERLRRYKKELRGFHLSRYTFDNIVGQSKGINQAKKLAKKAANSLFPVIIVGESGTGKELFAQAIHHASPRGDGDFIGINCAAIPRDLLESELFGYESGSFTGAGKSGKPGKFELAHKGTIFLDEIGDMPFEMQAKLLRILEEKEVERVGGIRPIEVDFRLISATHNDLSKLVKEGRFREDLYYRINVIQIYIPPLRERKEDIPLLIDPILQGISKKGELEPLDIDNEVLSILMKYSWPGNIRELINVLIAAVNASEGGTIRGKDLPPHLLDSFRPDHLDSAYLKRLRDEAERNGLLRLVEEAGGSVAKTSRMLGVHRTTIYKKLRRHNLSSRD